jgi:hypothetical protein
MVNYWIETPIENALEVIQRYLNEPSHALSGWAGKVVNYTPPTEVVFYTYDFNNWVDDYSKIYYGRLYLASDDSFLDLMVTDGGNNLFTFTFSLSQGKSGMYDGVIFNSVPSLPSGNVVFAGYQFNVEYQPQEQSRIKVYAPISGGYTFDIGTITQSQDDTNVSVLEADGTVTTYSIFQTPFASPVHIECIKNTLAVPGWLEIKCNGDINYADLTYIQGEDFYDIELIACDKLTYLNLTTSASIPNPSFDRILRQLVNYNQQNGTLILPNNSYLTGYLPYNPLPKADYDTLISRGWTIT